MNRLIEAGAKAGFKDAWGSSGLNWDIDLTEKQQDEWRHYAKATYTAMVEAMGDEGLLSRALFLHLENAISYEVRVEILCSSLLQLAEVDHE